MTAFNKNIYEELIADNQFVDWVSGKDNSNSTYWEKWEEEHPEFCAEFEKAQKTVKMFRFIPPDVSEKEINYLWQKTSSQFSRSGRSSILPLVISWSRKIAAVLVIPLTIAVVWLYLDNTSIKTEFNRILSYNQSKTITVKAPLGGRLNFELPDGSMVWLNSGSEIKYPASFKEASREVSVFGEAYFKVKKGDVPFLVNNLGPQVKVYGTEFNVNAYKNEDEVKVALASGIVSLTVNSKEVFLAPGEVSMFNKVNRTLTIQKSDINQFVSWREGKFIFRDATLGAIMRTLERQYNVDIKVVDEEIIDYRYNAIIQEQSLEQILELLKLSAPIKINYNKQKQQTDGSFSRAEITISKDEYRILN